MKLRNGHVSNSSSSSFIIVIKKKDYEDVLRGLDGLPKKIAKAFAWECLGNKDLIMVANWSEMDGSDTLDHLGFRKKLGLEREDEEDEDVDEDRDVYGLFHDAWDEVQDALEEKPSLYLKNEDN